MSLSNSDIIATSSAAIKAGVSCIGSGEVPIEAERISGVFLSAVEGNG